MKEVTRRTRNKERKTRQDKCVFVCVCVCVYMREYAQVERVNFNQQRLTRTYRNVAFTPKNVLSRKFLRE